MRANNRFKDYKNSNVEISKKGPAAVQIIRYFFYLNYRRSTLTCCVS